MSSVKWNCTEGIGQKTTRPELGMGDRFGLEAVDRRGCPEGLLLSEAAVDFLSPDRQLGGTKLSPIDSME